MPLSELCSAPAPDMGRDMGTTFGSLWRANDFNDVASVAGGQGGIRTRGGCYTTHAFQACALNHSATCPAVGRSYSAPSGAGNAIFPCDRPLASFRHRASGGVKWS